MHEVRRAVNWVKEPGWRRGVAAGALLLALDAMLGKGLQQVSAHVVFHLHVGFRDPIGGVAFGMGAWRVSKCLADHLRGGARQILCQGVGRLQRAAVHQRLPAFTSRMRWMAAGSLGSMPGATSRGTSSAQMGSRLKISRN